MMSYTEKRFNAEYAQVKGSAFRDKIRLQITAQRIQGGDMESLTIDVTIDINQALRVRDTFRRLIKDSIAQQRTQIDAQESWLDHPID